METTSKLKRKPRVEATDSVVKEFADKLIEIGEKHKMDLVIVTSVGGVESVEQYDTRKLGEYMKRTSSLSYLSILSGREGIDRYSGDIMFTYTKGGGRLYALKLNGAKSMDFAKDALEAAMEFSKEYVKTWVNSKGAIPGERVVDAKFVEHPEKEDPWKAKLAAARRGPRGYSRKTYDLVVETDKGAFKFEQILKSAGVTPATHSFKFSLEDRLEDLAYERIQR